jgi:hypothetical protein
MQKFCLSLVVLMVLAGSQAAGTRCPAAAVVCAAEDARAQDLRYLLHLDPDAVSDRDLYERAVMLEENYQAHHCASGIVWEAQYDAASDEQPSFYGTGGDSAIFTGFYLAGAVYRFRSTGLARDLDAVFEAARGLHVLTHVSGTPGVIARQELFPATAGAAVRRRERLCRAGTFAQTDGVFHLAERTASNR